MAAQAKRYYWLKLKEDFFRDKMVKKLRRLEHGDRYVLIYLEMMLASIAHEGRLYFEGIEDTFCAELAMDLNEREDDVEHVLALLKRYGRLEEENAETFYLEEAHAAVGTESTAAQRMRHTRAKRDVSKTDTTAKQDAETRDAIREDMQIERHNVQGDVPNECNNVQSECNNVQGDVPNECNNVQGGCNNVPDDVPNKCNNVQSECNNVPDDVSNECNNVQGGCNNVQGECNNVPDDVPTCYTEIEIEIEKEIEKEREKQKEQTPHTPSAKAAAASPTSPEQIAALYHAICVSFPKLRGMSGKRRRAVTARIREHPLAEFRRVFTYAEQSAFLQGANSRGWTADFDWMMCESNFVKILEGKYQGKEQNHGIQQASGGGNAPADYDASRWETSF